MKNVDLFPIVFKDTYNFDWDNISPRVMNLISEAEDESYSKVNGKTTVALNHFFDKRPHAWPEFFDYVEWLKPKVEFVWARWGLLPQRKFVTGSWFNLHTKGSYTKEHYHHSTHIVVTAYLKCPPDSGCIQFRTPYELQKLSEPVATPDAGLWEDCLVETNDVIFFPGWIRHRTQVSQSDDPRIVLTMNISGAYEDGH